MNSSGFSTLPSKLGHASTGVIALRHPHLWRRIIFWPCISRLLI